MGYKYNVLRNVLPIHLRVLVNNFGIDFKLRHQTTEGGGTSSSDPFYMDEDTYGTPEVIKGILVWSESGSVLANIQEITQNLDPITLMVSEKYTIPKRGDRIEIDIYNHENNSTSVYPYTVTNNDSIQFGNRQIIYQCHLTSQRTRPHNIL